jgi:hypothetical protein
MYKVSFSYPIGDKMLNVNATCKEINDTEIKGLTLLFTDVDDNAVKVEFDGEMFDDIEAEANAMLCDMYYNPELNFSQSMRHH